MAHPPIHHRDQALRRLSLATKGVAFVAIVGTGGIAAAIAHATPARPAGTTGTPAGQTGQTAAPAGGGAAKAGKGAVPARGAQRPGTTPVPPAASGRPAPPPIPPTAAGGGTGQADRDDPGAGQDGQPPPPEQQPEPTYSGGS